jgi:DNA end-binding protein Ku
MTAKWNASKFHDEYRDALMKLVERKIKTGQTEAIEEAEEAEAPIGQTINFMDVLKRSVEHAGKGRTKSGRAAAKPKASTRRRRPHKQRAG